jgi:hypothetical protein
MDGNHPVDASGGAEVADKDSLGNYTAVFAITVTTMGADGNADLF